MNWPVPTSVKSLQWFLGFTHFYHSFVHDCSSIAAPLMSLFKGNAKQLIWNMLGGVHKFASCSICSQFKVPTALFHRNLFFLFYKPGTPLPTTMNINNLKNEKYLVSRTRKLRNPIEIAVKVYTHREL